MSKHSLCSSQVLLFHVVFTYTKPLFSFLNWLTAFPVSVCMRRSSAGELVPLDLEIEATFRRNNAERKRKLLHDRTVASILEEAYFFESSSSNSPTSKDSQTAEFEAEVMAEEQPRRVTLEDYSSTSVP